MFHAKYLSSSSFGLSQKAYIYFLLYTFVFTRRSFKIFLKNRLQWQPVFFLELNSLDNFGRASCKNIPVKFQQILPSGLGGEVVSRNC
jgi:hypothetical protein